MRSLYVMQAERGMGTREKKCSQKFNNQIDPFFWVEACESCSPDTGAFLLENAFSPHSRNWVSGFTPSFKMITSTLLLS